MWLRLEELDGKISSEGSKRVGRVDTDIAGKHVNKYVIINNG